MFVFKENPEAIFRATLSNDVKDAADIVFGITGDEAIAKTALLDLASMSFGDEISYSDICTISCVRTVQDAVAASAESIFVACMACLWKEIKGKVALSVEEDCGLSAGASFSCSDVAAAINKALSDQLVKKA